MLPSLSRNRFFLVFAQSILLVTNTTSSLKLPPTQAHWSSFSSPISTSPSCRSGATACPDAQHGGIYLFGGYREEISSEDNKTPKRFVTNDVWYFNATTSQWSCLQQPSSSSDVKDKTNIPGPRLCSASAMIDHEYFLFGGWDPEQMGTGGQILDDIWALDTQTLHWRHVGKLPDGPTSRHVAVALPNKHLILLHTHRCDDHVLLYDPKKGGDGGGSIYKQPTSGTAPSSRGLHVATSLQNGKYVFVFGGADKSGAMVNDSFLLDTDTWKWHSISSSSSEHKHMPSPRAGAVATSTHSMPFIFGGAERNVNPEAGGGLIPKGDVWGLHIDFDDNNNDDESSTMTGVWKCYVNEDASNAPPPRNAAILVNVDHTNDKQESHFILANGWHPFVESFEDSHRLVIVQQTNDSN